MSTITATSASYSAPSDESAAHTLGGAFFRACVERSVASDDDLRHAIVAMASLHREERIAPEASIVAFKEALLRFGGLHAPPGLALEHHADGDECAAIYELAFKTFVDAYFTPAAASIEAR